MAGFLSIAKRIYFSIYIWTVFVGWVQVLYFALKALRESGHTAVYDAVERPLLLASDCRSHGGGPRMSRYMLGQRKKVLSKSKTA